MNGFTVGAFALFAISAGVAITSIVRRLALRIGAVTQPNPIVPQHTEPVAHLGGLAVGASTLLVGLFVGFWGRDFGISHDRSNMELLQIGLPGALFLLLGLYDDLRPLEPLPKLLAQTAISVIAVALGLEVRITGIVIIDASLTGLWILVLVNAFNLTDVCDGLLTGLAVVSLLFFVFVMDHQPLVPAIVALCSIGFLFHNAPPAKIFLGDSGNHLLGFVVAAMSLRSFRAIPLWPGIPVLMMSVGVPLFELVFLVAVRISKRIPWWRGSPDHFSLRLQAAGFSRIQTDLIAWAAAIASCFIAWRLLDASWVLGICLIAFFSLAAWACARWLLRWEVEGNAR